MEKDLEARMEKRFAADPSVGLAVLFGSVAWGRARRDSDVDLAVAGAAPLTADEKAALIADLAVLTGRPVDLIDLSTAGTDILRQALRKGRLVYLKDRALYAELIKRLVFEQADWLPYRDRILAERRRKWISGS
jgi:predicted nucleotidyltransferase